MQSDHHRPGCAYQLHLIRLIMHYFFHICVICMEFVIKLLPRLARASSIDCNKYCFFVSVFLVSVFGICGQHDLRIKVLNKGNSYMLSTRSVSYLSCRSPMNHDNDQN